MCFNYVVDNPNPWEYLGLSRNEGQEMSKKPVLRIELKVGDTVHSVMEFDPNTPFPATRFHTFISKAVSFLNKKRYVDFFPEDKKGY